MTQDTSEYQLHVPVECQSAGEMQTPAPVAPTCRTRTCCAAEPPPSQHHVPLPAVSATRPPSRHTHNW